MLLSVKVMDAAIELRKLRSGSRPETSSKGRKIMYLRQVGCSLSQMLKEPL